MFRVRFRLQGFSYYNNLIQTLGFSFFCKLYLILCGFQIQALGFRALFCFFTLGRIVPLFMGRIVPQVLGFQDLEFRFQTPRFQDLELQVQALRVQSLEFRIQDLRFQKPPTLTTQIDVASWGHFEQHRRHMKRQQREMIIQFILGLFYQGFTMVFKMNLIKWFVEGFKSCMGFNSFRFGFLGLGTLGFEFWEF